MNYTAPTNFILLLLIMVSCKPKPPEELSITTAEEPMMKVDKYTFLSSYVHDTTLVFDNFDSMNDYRVGKDIALWNFKDSVSRLGNDSLLFRIESIKFLNEDLYTYQIFKLLKITEKTKNHLMLLQFNLDFSTIITIDQRIRTFSEFPIDVRRSALGLKVIAELQNRLEQNIQIDIGAFEDFILYKPAGTTVELKSLLKTGYENYLLVFGASWCSPCRYENQLLGTKLSTLDTTKLKIIGISVDENVGKWLKMIEKDKSPWTTVRDKGGLNAGLSKALMVGQLPTNILLNKSHEIVDRQINIELILKRLMNKNSL
jgi:peroxiredoxin